MWIRPIGLALAALLVGAACAPSGQVLRPLDERAVKARQAVSGLEAEDDGGLSDHLEQAKAWLARFEARRAADRPDVEGLALLMDVVDGQLARIKTALERRGAEQRLAERQARYAAESKRLQTVRREASQLKGGEGKR